MQKIGCEKRRLNSQRLVKKIKWKQHSYHSCGDWRGMGFSIVCIFPVACALGTILGHGSIKARQTFVKPFVATWNNGWHHFGWCFFFTSVVWLQIAGVAFLLYIEKYESWMCAHEGGLIFCRCGVSLYILYSPRIQNSEWCFIFFLDFMSTFIAFWYNVAL